MGPSGNGNSNGIFEGLIQQFMDFKKMTAVDRDIRQSIELTGFVKVKREARKRKRVERAKYVERRKSWRRKRKKAA